MFDGNGSHIGGDLEPIAVLGVVGAHREKTPRLSRTDHCGIDYRSGPARLEVESGHPFLHLWMAQAMEEFSTKAIARQSNPFHRQADFFQLELLQAINTFWRRSLQLRDTLAGLHNMMEHSAPDNWASRLWTS